MTTLNTRISSLATAIGSDMKLVLNRVGSLELAQFSGDFDDLTNKPTKLSEFENDVGYVTSGGGNGGIIKTFNVLNEFSAPLLGSAIYIPSSTDYIRSVQLTNSRPVSVDLMAGLYRNNVLLGFYTIPSGQITARYNVNNFIIGINDYITVNIVAGSGFNFSLALLNTSFS